MQRPSAAALFVTALASALACSSYGCVYENRCVGDGVSRGVDGKCRGAEAMDGGVDAGDFDAGDFDAGDFDAGDFDAGAGDDAGAAEKVVQVAAGAAHVCVRTNMGRLFCRGSNLDGQLGTGGIGPRDGPVLVDLGSGVLSIAGNHTTVCAQTEAPAVYCWGGNSNGHVGDGTTAPQVTTPAMIGSASTAALASSFANTCFTGLAGGTVCWGRNDVGQLGYETGGADVGVPGMQVETDRGGGVRGPLESVSAITIADRHACFIVGSSMYCVGGNAHAQLGAPGPQSSLALQVPGLTGVTSIATAAEHTCAVAGSNVYCWGGNEHGECDPSTAPADVTAPTEVTGLPAGALQVVTSMDSSCALLDTNDVWCWGWRLHGGIGDGMAGLDAPSPPSQVLISSVEALSASFVWLTCALDINGDVSCWGEDAISLLAATEPTRVFSDGVSLHASPVTVAALP